MDSQPYIHPFKTLYNYYIYDVNTDMIVKVDKDVYSYLQQASAPAPQQIHDTIEQMQADGFLSSHRIKNIKHPASDLLEYHLSRHLKMLTLQITQNCNLRCKYCTFSGNYKNRGHKAVNMSFEMAKKGIDYLISHSVDCKQLDFGFYGGEPLLVFDLVKSCILYAEQESEGKSLTFNITTNGTLLNEEIIRFFERHQVRLMISLDGPKDIHNKNRGFANSEKGSYDILIENIRWIKEKHPEYYRDWVLFNTVLDPQNSFSCVNEFFASSDMFDNSILSATLISDSNIKEHYEIPESYTTELNYEMFKVFLFMMGRLKMDHVSKVLLTVVEEMNHKRGSKQNSAHYSLSDTAHHGGPCIAGARRLFLSVDGTFYPCERVSETSDVMKIGNIDEGVDPEKAGRLLNVGTISAERCKNCWAFIYCSVCAAKADNETELSDELVKTRCPFERNRTEEMFKDYCTLCELGYDFGSESVKENHTEVG